MKQYILALDQGTTSSRAVLFDHSQRLVALAQQEFPQHFPKAGWVEHDPMDILRSQQAVMEQVLQESGVTPQELAAIGITNQRETAVIWEKDTGKPIYNAIVWQCRRTSGICDRLREQGHAPYIQQKTGLVIDAYFSGTKFQWILDQVEGARERAEKGELLAGTVDSWLTWNLTGGQTHVTDYTNASRTMLFDIERLCWDGKLLELMNIPEVMLPRVQQSSSLFGYARLDGASVPITGIAGDQQAALFGQVCFEKGEAKNTYGTGCFLLMNTGEKLVQSGSGLISTIACGLNGRVTYALEGSVFVGGAVVQWLRDELRMIEDPSQMEGICSGLSDNGGVYVVPAFTGLGAPYWDMYARGTIVGLTRGSTREHIIRAAEESIAYQVADVVRVMEQDSGTSLSHLKVDGGASRDGFLLQFQSDILGTTIRRGKQLESTAMGAAFLAGLEVGFWQDIAEIGAGWQPDVEFSPSISPSERQALCRGWSRAVEKSRRWAAEE
ncbi:glycerol kinase GlpK [Oscillospiraceae bacterium MB08-C2-2]|nr:glycerol kinase GlpK [Oscillospiraceae bacterium MB08-C2-2]